MSKTRKVKSRGKKQKKIKTRQRKTRQRKTRQRKSNRVGSTKRFKIVKLSLGKKTRRHKRKMRGGYGKGACPLIGAPWNATAAANYYPVSKYGVVPGGTQTYPGDSSPSPQHGGHGLWQHGVLNPYRGALGSLGNLRNVYDGKERIPSSYPQIQNQLVPQTHFIPDIDNV